MFIQFAGYDIEANSRIYNFDVMDPPREAREFTVEIESKTSRWGSLQLQDGPSICFERLRRELERETPESCVEPHLHIGEQDVREYLARQHPQKKAFGHKWEQANPLSRRPTQAFPAAEKPAIDFRSGVAQG
jgi:hypothetical protein